MKSYYNLRSGYTKVYQQIYQILLDEHHQILDCQDSQQGTQILQNISQYQSKPKLNFWL